jgi:hypothetical protein
MKKVYLAGPMTGIEDYNYPAFHQAAAELRAQGFEVLNPAEHFGGDQSLPYETYMRGAIQAVLEADMIYTLPGWQQSRGARMEMLLAQRLGIPHLNVDASKLWNLEAAFAAPPMRVLQVVDGRVVGQEVVHG